MSEADQFVAFFTFFAVVDDNRENSGWRYQCRGPLFHFT